MEIQGRIIAVLPQRSGTSKSSGKAWSCASYVLETQEMHPKHLAFDVLNGKITQFNIQQGEYVKVSFDIDAHEFNGKWYNGVRAWDVQRFDGGQAQQPQAAFAQQAQQPQQPAAAQQQASIPSADPNLPF